MKILIVEDDILLQNLYKEWIPGLIAHYNFSSPVIVEFANSGTEAKTILEFKKYDITFLDMVLPGISGVELFKKYVDSMGEVVLCSSHVEYFKEYLGFENYPFILQKPFDFEKILHIFDKLLKEKFTDVDFSTDNTGKKYKTI